MEKQNGIAEMKFMCAPLVGWTMDSCEQGNKSNDDTAVNMESKDTDSQTD